MADMTDIQLGATARSVEDVILLKEMGLALAEIAITDPEGFYEQIDGYREVADRTRIKYLCHGPREGDPNDIHALEKSYLPKVLKIFPIMPKLDMSLLTIHLWLDRRFIKKDTITRKTDMLNEITEYASNLGISVCLENMSERAEDLSEVLQDVPLLNITLDLGHAQLLSDKNTSHGFIEQFPEKIKHIHIHDNYGGNSPEDDLHLPIGKGSIDFVSIFSELRRIPYRGSMTLELKPFEIRECIDYAKALIRGDFNYPVS
jgi:sugar phosphate isomerase/epimerase